MGEEVGDYIYGSGGGGLYGVGGDYTLRFYMETDDRVGTVHGGGGGGLSIGRGIYVHRNLQYSA